MKNTTYIKLIHSLFFLTLVFTMCNGQDAKDIYKQRVQEYRDNAQRGTAIFLNKNLSDEERLAALEGISEFLEPEDVNAGEAILRDGQESEQIRTAALASIHNKVANDTKLARYVLDLVESNNTPPQLRNNAFQTIRVLSFSATVSSGLRDEINQTMRKLTTDEDPGFRKVALGWLVARKDDFGHRLILEGLQNPDNALVSAEEGIAILGFDLKSDAFPVLYTILKNPPSEASKIEAAKLLGSYTPAVQDLVGILQNPEEPEQLRLAAIGTLDANQPDNFSTYTLPLLIEKNTPNKLSAYALRAEMYRRTMGKKSLVRNADQFDLEVRKIANDTSNSVLQKLAGQYLKTIAPQF